MTTKTMYIAEDGKTFYDKDKCLEYEEDLMTQSMQRYVHLFNESGDEISFSLSDDCFADAWFIQILSDDVAEIIDERISTNLLPWGYDKGTSGTWIWNIEQEQWISFDWIEKMYKDGMKLFK